MQIPVRPYDTSIIQIQQYNQPLSSPAYEGAFFSSFLTAFMKLRLSEEKLPALLFDRNSMRAQKLTDELVRAK
jgi:hypothetical protein